jgi:hypothetical protein
VVHGITWFRVGAYRRVLASRFVLGPRDAVGANQSQRRSGEVVGVSAHNFALRGLLDPPHGPTYSMPRHGVVFRPEGNGFGVWWFGTLASRFTTEPAPSSSASPLCPTGRSEISMSRGTTDSA